MSSKTIEGSAWIVLGAIVCIWAHQTGLGTFREPGGGFVAFASGLFLLFVGLGIISSKGPDRGEEIDMGSSIERQNPRVYIKLIYTLALLCFYGLCLNLLGYGITTFVLMFGLFFDPARRGWKMALLSALFTTAATYTVFQVWLQVQFPRGIFPWW